MTGVLRSNSAQQPFMPLTVPLNGASPLNKAVNLDTSSVNSDCFEKNPSKGLACYTNRWFLPTMIGGFTALTTALALCIGVLIGRGKNTPQTTVSPGKSQVSMPLNPLRPEHSTPYQLPDSLKSDLWNSFVKDNPEAVAEYAVAFTKGQTSAELEKILNRYPILKQHAEGALTDFSYLVFRFTRTGDQVLSRQGHMEVTSKLSDEVFQLLSRVSEQILKREIR